MILVDSSVWVDFFSSAPGAAGQSLRQLIAQNEPVALAGIIVTEVLQGLTRNVERIQRELALFDILEPAGFSTYARGAWLYRLARSKGVTLAPIDCFLAALAMEHQATVFTLDTACARLARLTNLPLHS